MKLIDDTPNDDPVFQDDSGKWNFWDETGSRFIGPHESEEEAVEAWKEYHRSYITRLLGIAK